MIQMWMRYFIAKKVLYYNKVIKSTACNLTMGILIFEFHQERKQKFKCSPCHQIITEWLYVVKAVNYGMGTNNMMCFVS